MASLLRSAPGMTEEMLEATRASLLAVRGIHIHPETPDNSFMADIETMTPAPTVYGGTKAKAATEWGSKLPTEAPAEPQKPPEPEEQGVACYYCEQPFPNEQICNISCMMLSSS